MGFYKFPQALCKACGFISFKTGEVVSLTPAAKIIYTYMISRWQFFVVGQGGEYFETHATIGDQCAFDAKTVSRQLKTLVDHGVIDCVKVVSGGGHARYRYTDIKSDLTLVYKEYKTVVANTKTGEAEPVEDIDDEFLKSIKA